MNNYQQPAGEPARLHKVTGRILRSWIELTADEQKAVLTVTAIFLLGLTMRCWHVHKAGEAPTPVRVDIQQQAGKPGAY